MPQRRTPGLSLLAAGETGALNKGKEPDMGDTMQTEGIDVVELRKKWAAERGEEITDEEARTRFSGGRPHGRS